MVAALPPFLLAYSLQLGVVVTVLWVLLRILASRASNVRLRAWQATLVLVIVLPVGVFVPIAPMSSGDGTGALLSIVTVSMEPQNDIVREAAGLSGSSRS